MARAGVSNRWDKARWWLKRIRRGAILPCNLVRLCRRRQEFVSIINEATTNTPPWSPDLIDRVVKFVLEEGAGTLSVHEAATTDPFDHGHSLGVIAEGIAQDDFRPPKRKRGCTRGTLLIPRFSFSNYARLRFTPKGNLDFYPANDWHFDLSCRNVRKLAEMILDGIHNRTIAWTFLGNQNNSYQLQAAIAYSYCLSVFGKLDPSDPPSEWISGKHLPASEQIETLKHLANTSVVDSPIDTT